MTRRRKPPPPKPPLVRGEPVVEKVLDAAVRELARVGYEALRFEEVAALAGVARTTVYRRWPTRADLVRAAIDAMPGAEVDPPDTGSLRGDLVELGMRIARFSSTPQGRAVMRLFAAGEEEDELSALLGSIRARRESIPRHILERARDRGEIAKEADARWIAELLPAAIFNKVILLRERIDRPYVEGLVDHLVRPAEPRRGRPVRARA